MTVTDEMVRAAANILSERNSGDLKEWELDARLALTAALAAMWRDIKDAPKDLISAAPDLLDCAKLAEQSVHRSKSIRAPEDAEIEGFCERIGYGAVMDAASRLWIRKDPIGAFTVGPCVATVQSAIAKADGHPPATEVEIQTRPQKDESR